jgi:Peptidase family M23
MKRVLALLPVLLALQVGVSPALAWTWPVDGPVLRPFTFDPNDPYAGGQHRGIDVGAPSGAPVRAPAAGTVSFAGNVPGGGLTLAVQTADGYSVTLVHLGALGVARGTTVEEGDVVGSVGPSGEPELAEPYVHLGIRVTADQQGYVDPLSLLPARNVAPTADVPAAPEAGAAEPTAEDPVVESGKAAKSAGAPGSRAEGRNRPDAGKTLRQVGRPAPRVERETPRAARSPALAVTPPSEERVNAPDRSLPVRTPAKTAATRTKESPGSPGRFFPATVLLALSAGAAGLAVRRQLRDARVAHGAAAVLSEARAATAEDADRLRLGEEDHVLAHGDLERVLLAQAEALPDLDRDDDPAELVYVADDPRRAGSSLGLCGHGPRGCSRSHRRRPTPLSARSFR